MSGVAIWWLWSVSFQFYCDPKDLHEVKMSLQAQDVTVAESRFTYIPLNYVKLEGVELKYAGEMIDLMLDLETVIRIHDNIEAVEDPASWHSLVHTRVQGNIQ